MNGHVLNKLSPDTQREDCAPQTTQHYCKAQISFSSPSQSPPASHPPPFPLVSLDERQGLPQTEISPVISTEAHSRWGKKYKGYNNMKGRKEASIYVW